MEKKGPTAPTEPVDIVTVDQKTAITLKPDARPKWLSKACKMTQEGKASATELYNIVVSRRFSAGLPERIGKKLGVIVRNNLNLFSEKQRRHLSSSEFQLNSHMVEATAADDDEDEKAEAEAPPAVALQLNATAERTEAMMATCRTFVREQAADTTVSRRQTAEEKEAQEADRMTKLVEEAAKKSRREAAQREEKKRFNVLEAEQLSRTAVAQAEAQRRKQEEEADALFERALCPVPAGRESARESRRRGRSRSVSAKRVSESPPRRGRKGHDWRGTRPGELTGSRAILLNRDFQEDLPHLPRPNQTGPKATSFKPDASRSRSRSRRRRRG